jgi:hypothetical protein
MVVLKGNSGGRESTSPFLIVVENEYTAEGESLSEKHWQKLKQMTVQTKAITGLLFILRFMIEGQLQINVAVLSGTYILLHLQHLSP